MRPQRSYGTKVITQRRARQALCQLLYGCTDERLARFTAEQLAGSYRVSLQTAAEMLAGARRARGG